MGGNISQSRDNISHTLKAIPKKGINAETKDAFQWNEKSNMT